MKPLYAIVISALLVVSPAVAVAQEGVSGLPFEKKLKLAKVGDDEAQLAVAIAYEEGDTVRPDAQEAVKWYRQAALLGNMDAQFRLARLVAKGADGLTKNQTMAAQLFEAAANGGQVMAQNAMGDIYQQGKGVTADMAKAAKWYEKASVQNFAPAQNSLGLMYLNGTGVPRDLNKAAELFKQAADQGDGWGLNNLGGMHEMGWGVPKDTAKAADLYRQAVAKGIESARKNLIRVEPNSAKKN